MSKLSQSVGSRERIWLPMVSGSEPLHGSQNARNLSSQVPQPPFKTEEPSPRSESAQTEAHHLENPRASPLHIVAPLSHRRMQFPSCVRRSQTAFLGSRSCENFKLARRRRPKRIRPLTGLPHGAGMIADLLGGYGNPEVKWKALVNSARQRRQR